MMKRNSLLLMAATLCVAVVWIAAGIAEEPAAVQKHHEQVEAKVLKVLAAKDGAAVFRAYIVSWQGHEVVASDPLVATAYKEGDVAPVLVMWMPYPDGRPGSGLLAFQALAKRR
ncbi:MAG: hypothetical protein U1F98_10915 [Verrucomicrobiota bacterium]